MPASPASASSEGVDTPAGAGARILVVGVSWLGDCVMTLPAIRRLRQRLPGAHIAVLSKPSVAAVWSLFKEVDETLVMERGVKGTLWTVRAVRKGRFDFAYVLPKSFRSALIPFLAGIRGRKGLRGHSRDWMLSESMALPPESAMEHQCHEYLRLIGVEDHATLFLPFVQVSLEDKDEARRLAGGLESESPLVGLFPGAAYGPAKRWPPERFAEVGRRLRDSHGARVIVLGSATDAAECARVAELLGGQTLNLCAKTPLRQLAGVLSLCRVVISNDSGGMHLAAALGVPVVAIFGITDPVRTGPIGDSCRVLTARGVRGRRDIPRHSLEARAAMLSIRADEVYQAAAELIGRLP